MAYPQQQQQQQPQVKKKVEWSTNLSSSEPQQTENSNPDWDSEAGKYCFMMYQNISVVGSIDY